MSIAYEMRNALSHGYFDIDLDVVWTTIQTDRPKLKMQVAALLSSAAEDSAHI